MDTFLSKEDSNVIKGVAVILLLAHHLWAFPDRIPYALKSIFFFTDINLPMLIGDFGKICVSLFFFLSGYGNEVKYHDKEFSLFSKLKTLYLNYWKVFVIFIPIGFLFFSNQQPYCANVDICTVFSNFNPIEFILNLIGWSATYNGEWWFFRDYAIMILLFPLFKKLINKNSLLINIFFVIIFELFYVLIGTMFDADHFITLWAIDRAPYMICFPMGMIAARFSLLQKAAVRIKRNSLRVIICLAALAVCFVCKVKLGGLVEVIVAPVFIIAFSILCAGLGKFRRIMTFFGKHSMNMWLIHSFFCYYYGVVSKSIVFFRWALAALLVLIIYTTAASLAVDGFWGAVSKVSEKLICKDKS